MRALQIDQIRERIGALRTDRGPSLGAIEGAPLRLRATHEWFGPSIDRRDWSPPLGVLAALATRGLEAGLLGHVAWIGRRVFPYPPALDRRTLAASVFVDAPSLEARVWAMDLALRAQTPIAVIADARGMTLAQSRRVQLAAAHGNGIGLLARPALEEGALSAAVTRWRIDTDSMGGIRWSMTLLRHKDEPRLMDRARCWIAEWNDGEGLVTRPAVVDGGARRPARTA